METFFVFSTTCETKQCIGMCCDNILGKRKKQPQCNNFKLNAVLCIFFLKQGKAALHTDRSRCLKMAILLAAPHPSGITVLVEENTEAMCNS